MRKKPLGLLFLPLLTALSSCGGYSLDYIVSGDMYISSVFTKNYYQHWDNELTTARKVDAIDVTSNAITSFKDITDIDDILLVNNPYDDPSKYPFEDSAIRQYAKDYRLMNYDKSFYYGVQSKMFDGEAYCDGYYQRHRVQADSNGFSVRFTKESDELKYFAMQFKATTNNQLPTYPAYSYPYPDYKTGQTVDSNVLINNPEKEGKDDWLYHGSTIDLTIGVYCKVGADIVNYQFKSTIEFKKELVEVTTTSGQKRTQNKSETNNGSAYKFFGFELYKMEGTNKAPLSRCVGFSVTFNVVSDDLISHNKDLNPNSNIDYALFIYEVFLPYTYWH